MTTNKKDYCYIPDDIVEYFKKPHYMLALFVEVMQACQKNPRDIPQKTVTIPISEFGKRSGVSYTQVTEFINYSRKIGMLETVSNEGSFTFTLLRFDKWGEPED